MSVIGYPGSLSQTTGGKYSVFESLKNLKNNTTGKHAVTKLVKGKTGSPNRPSTVSATKFQLNLPTGAKVTSVKVEYRQDLQPYNGKFPSINAPTISLLGVSGYSVKGSAPTRSMTTRSVTFKPVKSGDFSSSRLNSNSFGVKINYPGNSGEGSGYLRLSFIRVTVTFKSPSYTIGWGVNPKVVENDSIVDVSLKVSNKNLVDYQPTLTVTTPAGFSLVEAPVGDGVWSQVGTRVYTWKPRFSSSKGSISLGLRFDVSLGGSLPVSVGFDAVEGLTGASGSLSVSVVAPSEDSGSSDVPGGSDEASISTEGYFARLVGGPDEELTLNIDLTEEWKQALAPAPETKIINGNEYSKEVEEVRIEIFPVSDILFDDFNVYANRYGTYTKMTGESLDMIIDYPLDDSYSIKFKGTTSGTYVFKVIFAKFLSWARMSGGVIDEIDDSHNIDIGYLYINIRPTTLSTPNMTLLSLSNEELDRLGDGEVYTVQTYTKQTGKELIYQNVFNQSVQNESGTKSTILSMLPSLPKNFELQFELSKINGYGKLVIGAIDGYNGETSDPNYTVHAGFNSSGNVVGGVRTTNTDETTGSSSSSALFKITRENDTFKFYEDGTLFATKTASWFDNYSAFYIGLVNYGEGWLYLVNVIISNGSGEAYIRNWGNNFRLGIYNNPQPNNTLKPTIIQTETIDGEEININPIEIPAYDPTPYDSLTPAQIFEYAEYWSNPPTTMNTYNNLECEFTYNKDYPLYILLTGDYPEGNQKPVTFTEPVIIESDTYNGWEPNGNYPEPIINTIQNSENSQITIPEYENSTPITVYQLDIDENYLTDDISIRGMGVEITIEEYSDIAISAEIRSPTGHRTSRSTILTPETLTEDNTLIIGGIGDLWEFTTEDYAQLHDFEVTITAQNTLTNTTTTLTGNNTQIIFYIEEILQQNHYCTINNEDIRFYGAFIKNIDIPAGLETDTHYLNINGTDTNDAYQQNIREKTITIELEIGDNCNLTEATDNLRKLTQLLLNKRDKYNRPIPKKIEFNFQPDVYYEYIIEDAFDNPIEISSYNIKTKLTIPSGTAYKNNTTVTNTTGYVQGIAKVNPTISLKPTGNSIEITETITGQKFTIHYPEETDQIIIIDCENRRLYLQNDEDSTDHTDITKYVDFNSDWFTLQDNYSFTGTNAYIRTVKYTERW